MESGSFFVLTVSRRMRFDTRVRTNRFSWLITCLKVLLNYLKKVLPVNS